MTRPLLTFIALLMGFDAVAGNFPLRASSNGRYFVDAGGNPFLMVGDSPQNIVMKLFTPDASALLYNRRTNGFNSLWIFAIAGPDNDAHTDAALQDGTKPFGGGNNIDDYDLSTPNEAYFSHVDLVLTMAATNGFNVLLHTFDAPSFMTCLHNNGSNACYAFGQYLGNRYKGYPNLIWVHGMDYHPLDSASDNSVMLAVAKGILSVDTNHLHTGDFFHNTGQHSDSLIDPSWFGIIGANWVYTYDPTYAQALDSYSRTNLVPVFFGEGIYEYESQVGRYGSRNLQRRQNYWSLLSGANGGIQTGNGTIWRCNIGWDSPTNLHSPAVVDIGHLTNLFMPRKWYDLVPDQAHQLVSAGYGTYASTGSPVTNDYAAAARTEDGTLGMVYTPVSHTLTVEMTNFSGSVTSRWYDPTAGTFTPILGSPFPNNISTNLTPPGTNAAGDGDWVLLLESGSATASNIVNIGTLIVGP